MSFLNIKITQKKNGQEAAWFKDVLGRRVGTRVGLAGDRAAITNAEQLVWLASYYIELQQEQLDKGIGSNGAAMPPLSGGSVARFKNTNGKLAFAQRIHGGYRGEKLRFGGKLVRDLYGPGKNEHMRDDIRINYVDDQMAKISITRKSSRVKALANERRAEWWGLSPESSRKFASALATVYGGAMEDYLDSLGLVQAGSYVTQLARALNARRRLLRAA